MPIRITGMNSGLDTESIISELVKAQRTKVDSTKKKQTKIQWKQDAWKELNTKIHNLFQKTLANMRFTTDYSKKITDISNPSIASIISSDDAMNATQKLTVDELATTGYLTGKEVNGDVTKTTKLTDLGIAEGSTITVTTSGKATDIKITEGMTVGSFVASLKSAGVEANFDEKNKRFHIAAAKSGKDNDFTLTASNSDGTDALNKLGILSYDTKTLETYKKYADMNANAIKEAVDADVAKRLQSYISQRKSLLETQEKQEKAIEESKNAFSAEFDSESIEAALANKDTLKGEIDQLKADIEAAGDAATEADKERLAKLQNKMSAVENYEKQTEALEATKNSIEGIEEYLDVSDPNNIKEGSKLTEEVEKAWKDKTDTAKDIIDKTETSTVDGTTTITIKKDGDGNPLLQGNSEKKLEGQDAQITLNGVTYKGETNTFEVNGLTITALQKSSEEVTLTTRRDTEGVYNIIKNFLKEYNALINEMDKLYNAEAAKDYEPLTDDEKKELSDSEVEKWESKIKDSILRRDSNLSSISTAMKTVMLKGAMVNGKQMYLSSFGIETLGYMNAAENERNAYHINGDEDDSAVSSKTNDLKAAIAADPDTVIAFFSQLAQNLYSELDKQSRSIEGIRSFGSFYDDKKMQSDYDDYKTKIKKQEDKLTAMEDRWYKKFTAMETAMAKMQSNQSAITSLLGG